jgi:hypothetical protein
LSGNDSVDPRGIDCLGFFFVASRGLKFGVAP